MVGTSSDEEFIMHLSLIVMAMNICYVLTLLLLLLLLFSRHHFSRKFCYCVHTNNNSNKTNKKLSNIVSLYIIAVIIMAE